MPRSACMRGSATTTIVPSSVDISCMPVIAMIAIPTTLEASGVRWVRRAANMGSHPTYGGEEALPRTATYDTVSAEKRAISGRSAQSQSLKLAGVQRVFDFLRVRDLSGGVTDEQRRAAHQ